MRSGAACHGARGETAPACAQDPPLAAQAAPALSGESMPPRKRAKMVGIDTMAARSSHDRVGPETMAGAFMWATDAIDSVTRAVGYPGANCSGSTDAGSSERTRRLSEMAARGIDLCSVYSGKGTGESAMAMVFHALENRCIIADAKEKLVVSYACDKDPLCQQILMAHGDNLSAPQHVFADLNDHLPERVRDQLNVIQDNIQGLGDGNDDRKKEMFAQMRHIIDEHARSVGLEVKTSYCVKHKKQCPVMYSSRSDSATKVMVATPDCRDWSLRGKRRGILGGTSRAWFIWLAEVRAALPDLILFEITEHCPAQQLLEDSLGDLYQVWLNILSPTDIGWPCNRPRNMGCLFRKGRALFEGDFNEMRALIFRSCQLNGDDLFLAPEHARMAEKRSLARRRGHHVSADSDIELADMLTPGQNEIVEKYRLARESRQGVDGVFLFDAEQHERFGWCGPYLPCLLSHGTIVSLSQGEIMMGLEHMSTMGEPVWRGYIVDPFGCAFQGLVDHGHITPRQWKSVAGLAAHLPLLGRLMVYVLSRTVMLDSHTNIMLIKLSSDAGVEDCDDESDSAVVSLYDSDDYSDPENNDVEATT